ncbi:UNVERIFIED_ORG: diguanylate cyclase (GGDEF)-like protein [Shinella zoogloeoides]|nr:diguanylate cyclase (GGDEF)-like protein [Shinella zoogloeoides]
MDALTGLLNRRGFDNRFQALMAKRGVHSLILCDLDHFKAVNDTYGHSGGDAALRAFGEMLAAAAPKDALVARIGGEEFALFLPHTGRDAAMLFAQGIAGDTRALARARPAAAFAHHGKLRGCGTRRAGTSALCHAPGG